MSKYLATDLDGTLLHPKSIETYVCKENSNVIKKFDDRVIIISGRNPQFIMGICDELKIPHTFIACNGAIIYENGEKFFTNKIEAALIKDIVQYIQRSFKNYYIIFFDENGYLYSIFDNEKIVIEKEEKALKAYPKLSYKTIKDINIVNKLIEENRVVKFNLVLNNEDKKTILEYLNTKYPKLSLAICTTSIEITNEGINKGESLKKLTNKLNLKDDDVYVIGDDGNDLSMFNLYKNSFLVKNDKNKHLESKVKHPLDKFAQLLEYMEE